MAVAPGQLPAILKGLGLPVTPRNLHFLTGWARAEGGNASYNPFNTTQGAPGAGSYNSVGVKIYGTPQQGVQATIQTLRNGRYGGILAALRSPGTTPAQFAAAVGSSPWGTSQGLLARVLGSTPVPTSTVTPPGMGPRKISLGPSIPNRSPIGALAGDPSSLLGLLNDNAKSMGIAQLDPGLLPQQQSAPGAGTSSPPAAPVLGGRTPVQLGPGGGVAGGIVQRSNFAGVDQGVDFRGSGPVPAFGDGIVTRVDTHSGWPGGGMVVYRLTSGPAKGRYVYVAENIAPHVTVGQRVKAGDVVAHALGSYPYIETGWAADAHGTTLAQAQRSGYVVGSHQFPTQQGKSFRSYLGV